MKYVLTKVTYLLLFIVGCCVIEAFKLNNKKGSALPNIKGQISTVVEEKVGFMKTLSPLTEVPLGQSIYIECSAVGIPPPTIHWLKDGKRISQGNQNDVTDDATNEYPAPGKLVGSTTVSRLFIDCAEPDDVGQYDCVAETPTHRIAQTTLVEIVDPEEDVESNACSKPEVPARIYMWTKTRMEAQKSTVQLFCRAEGVPTPRISWFDPKKKPINPKDPNYMMLLNGDLVVSNISFKSHAGEFTCVADNGFGTTTASTLLYPTRI